ncbi:unnamed protein product [Effrenium voratum]|nr:unnamed protein product [Effrenium voratum]
MMQDAKESLRATFRAAEELIEKKKVQVALAQEETERERLQLELEPLAPIPQYSNDLDSTLEFWWSRIKWQQEALGAERRALQRLRAQLEAQEAEAPGPLARGGRRCEAAEARPWQVEKVFSLQSAFQKIEVFSSRFFGRILTIDGDLMLTERDEFVYHEMIARVPLAYLANASSASSRGSALVVGGGDGGTAGQLLRWSALRVEVVELDEEVVRVCRRFFPRLSSSFEDPRVTLRFGDGAAWAAGAVQRQRRFDLILVDSTDFGAAEPLFRRSFHRNLQRLLKPRGVLVINLSSLSWQLELVRRSVARQRKIFRFVRVYQIFQPSYTSGHYCFAICSDDVDAQDLGLVDWSGVQPGRYYSRDVHAGAFALPEFARRAIDSPALLGNKEHGEAARSEL